MTEVDTQKQDLADVISGEEQTLIDETINEMAGIFNQSASEAYDKVGKLVLSKIFKVDPDGEWSVHDVQNDKPRVELFNHLQTELASKSKNEGGWPKKTWLYNSINLAFDKKRLSDFSDYESLTVSHRIELLSIDDIDQKKEFISKHVAKPMSVKNFRQLISDARLQGKKNKPGLLSCIKNPSLIKNIEDVPLYGGKRKENAIEEAEKQLDEIQAEIDKQEKYKATIKELKARLENYVPKPGRKPKN